MPHDVIPEIYQANERPEETYDEKNKREQLEKESTPFWLTNIFVRGPQWCIIVSFVILAWLTNKSFEDGMFTLADSEGRDFLVWSDPKVKADDMRNLARTYISDMDGVVVDEDGE